MPGSEQGGQAEQRHAIVDDAEIETRFTYHPPKGDQQQRYVDLRQLGRNFAEGVASYCPPSREAALALTNIEQAVMWANAAIARRE